MKGGKRRGIAGAMTARFLRTLGGRLYYSSSKNIVVIIAINSSNGKEHGNYYLGFRIFC